VRTSNGQPRPKEHDERWRDDPDVIKARLVAVGLATLVCCLGVIGVVKCFIGDVENVGRIGRFDSSTFTPYLST